MSFPWYPCLSSILVQPQTEWTHFAMSSFMAFSFYAMAATVNPASQHTVERAHAQSSLLAAGDALSPPLSSQRRNGCESLRGWPRPASVPRDAQLPRLTLFRDDCCGNVSGVHRARPSSVICWLQPLEGPAFRYFPTWCAGLDLGLSSCLYLSHRLCFTNESWHKAKGERGGECAERLTEASSLRNQINGGLTSDRHTLVHLVFEV